MVESLSQVQADEKSIMLASRRDASTLQTSVNYFWPKNHSAILKEMPREKIVNLHVFKNLIRWEKKEDNKITWFVELTRVSF